MNRTIKFRAWSTERKETSASLVLDCVDILHRDLNGLKPGLILMQFTGLHDKNGKEIYEGDIVEYEFGYENKMAEPVVFKGRSFSLDTGNNYMPEEHNREVIGNIYENSDLLV